MATLTVLADEIIKSLAAIVGEQAVNVSEQDRRHFAMDFSETEVQLPIAVVRPTSAAQVSEIVRLCALHGIAVSGRGGGMSYTRAHVPVRPESIILDMTGLNRIIEINITDRYVTVEPGVRWCDLREALRPTGYRVPYLGTLSGSIATIGGGLSQNATGTGRMTLAEHVLGLEVVTGDGSVVTTGSAAIRNTDPFYRYFGPDLSGLFLCDSGAFGIKTKATLILEPRPKVAFRTYCFDSHYDLIAAQCAWGKEALVTESFGFDGYYVNDLSKSPKPPALHTRMMVANFLADCPNKLWGVRNLLRAWHPSGLGFFAGKPNAVYAITEAYSQSAAEAMARRVDRIAKKFGGKSLPTAIPMGLRYGPWLNVGDIISTPRGEANFPVNAKFPASRAVAAMKSFDAFLAENKEFMDKHGIRIVCNYLLHGHFWGLEVVIYWKKPLSAYRAAFASDARKAAYEGVVENPENTAAAIDLRKRCGLLFRELGALHVQVARAYGYLDHMSPGTRTLIEGIKQVTDPHSIINPGSLGLGNG